MKYVWSRVVETIVAAGDLILNAGGKKMTLWEQTMLLLSPALSDSFKSLLGRIPPLKRVVSFLRMPS